MTYQQHPLSAAFPAMGAEDFQALKDSIEILGVQNAITLYEGMVLDGWHRYSAAQALGMPCPERELLAGVDPVDFVKAQNKERRHLPAGAWALIEAELWDWRPAHRLAENKSAPGADLSGDRPARTAEQMAQSAGVSVRSIERAKKVQRDAVPEVQAAVKSGGVSLKDAVAVSSLPPDEQAALAAAGPAAIKEAARASSTKPTPAPPAEKLAVRGMDDDAHAEMLADYERLQADNQMMARIFETDDRLAAAMQEVKRLTEENRVLQTRINGLVHEKNAAVASAKSFKRKLDALERRTGAA